jgi:hypothetical protein
VQSAIGFGVTGPKASVEIQDDEDKESAARPFHEVAIQNNFANILRKNDLDQRDGGEYRQLTAVVICSFSDYFH